MFLVLLAYLAFFSIALPDSMLGVAWPSMRLSFGESLGAAGLIPPFGVAATIVSTLASRRIVARFGVGRLLAASTLLSAIALGLSAASTSLPMFLVGVVLMGLSGGAIDVTLNAYAARNFGPRRINLLHASYVVGAAVSPALVTAVLQLGGSWRLPYLIIAVLQLGLAVFFASTARRWSHGSQAPRVDHHSGLSAPVLTRRAVLGVAAIVVQTGIESSVALWAYSFLTVGLGIGHTLAGLTASGYWLMMFLSRVVLGSVAERRGSWAVLGIGAAGLVLAAGLTLAGTAVPVAAVLGVLAFGLAAGPMYPLFILTTAERTGPAGVDRLVAIQAAASAIGAATLPPLFGIAMNVTPTAFAPILAGAVVAALLLNLLLRRQRRLNDQQEPGEVDVDV